MRPCQSMQVAENPSKLLNRKTPAASSAPVSHKNESSLVEKIVREIVVAVCQRQEQSCSSRTLEGERSEKSLKVSAMPTTTMTTFSKEEGAESIVPSGSAVAGDESRNESACAIVVLNKANGPVPSRMTISSCASNDDAEDEVVHAVVRELINSVAEMAPRSPDS